MFYVVKAAMEYSKSPRTPPQARVGRCATSSAVLNNVHPLVPLAVIALVIAAPLGWAIVSLIG